MAIPAGDFTEISQASPEVWIERAKEQLETVLAALGDPRSSDVDVFAPLSLARLALEIAWGNEQESEWPEDDLGPVCTCPPEITATGGFKGNCPARGVAHG